MKFIKLITFLGLSFSNHSAIAAATPEPFEDEEVVEQLDQRPRLRGFDIELINRMGKKPSLEHGHHNHIHNPHNCPMPSQTQLLGNQCTFKKDKRTICCNKAKTHSYVQCSKVCLTNAEDYDYEDAAFENYDYEDEDYDEVADALEKE